MENTAANRVSKSVEVSQTSTGDKEYETMDDTKYNDPVYETCKSIDGKQLSIDDLQYEIIDTSDIGKTQSDTCNTRTLTSHSRIPRTA